MALDGSNKSVLVIEDMESMRTQLKSSLSYFRFQKLKLVSNIRDALNEIKHHEYDVILCDYSLGEGTDGQQFLEYIRLNDLISRNTIFIIITAEQAYSSVILASECVPNDYILKPFTTNQFEVRIEKLLEKQEYFLSIDKAADAKKWKTVIQECDNKIKENNKFLIELMKIKAISLIKDKRTEEALRVYQEVLKIRPIDWAKLGIATTLNILNQKSDAETIVQDVISKNPKFMSAYDFMGRMLSSKGEKEAALEVLEKARAVSPGTMSRIREITDLAIHTGNPGLAETVMQQALHKHRHSPVRQAKDYVALSKALLHQGKADEAIEVIDTAHKTFTDGHGAILLHATESVAQLAVGNHKRSKAALTYAMLNNVVNELPPDTVIALAEACFAGGEGDEARRLLTYAIQNNHDNEALKEKAHNVFIQAGDDPEVVNELIKTTTAEVIKINNDGVMHAQKGELEKAILLLCEAAEALPNNIQIISNAALVLALDLTKNEANDDKLVKVLHYRKILINKSPEHPKLHQIDDLLQKFNP